MIQSNTLFQSLDRPNMTLSKDALALRTTLDQLTSAIVGRLISERLIDYASQPGQTIEYLSVCVAETILTNLEKCDTVEIDRFHDFGAKG